MITRVDSMIIGSEVTTNAWASATKGQIVMANENFEAFDGDTAKAQGFIQMALQPRLLT